MKPWLWLPPTWSHTMAPALLPLASIFSSNEDLRWKSINWKGQKFYNPLGIAGGVDKSGTQLIHWQKLGAGFLEVGTITPLPQIPNPGLIMDRDTKTFSVWNKMGFPNPGAERVKSILINLASHLKIPLFINIGKNRDTDNSSALQDYLKAFQILKDCGKTFIINISSPNTKGLRDLQSKTFLKSLLAALRQEMSEHHLLVKLSPDMSSDQLKESLDVGLEEKVDGFILTNTTLQRPIPLPYSPLEGGVSGDPLKMLSRQTLEIAVHHLGMDKQKVLLVSVGGIMDANEIQWRLDQGANLIQVYAALVYHGPYFFKSMARQKWV